MAKYRDLSETLGFTWDRTSVPRNVTGTDVRRALWRFETTLPTHVHAAGHLEGNPFTYPEVQTLLEGITVGGRRVSDQRQLLNLSAAGHDLIDLVRSGRFRIDKPTSDRINLLIARDEALEAGHFRGEGSIVTNVSVNMGRHGVHHPHPTERGGENLRQIFDRGTAAILVEVSDPFEQAAAHFLFAAFQQFYYDGNKRTARHLQNGHLMSYGIDAISVPAAWSVEFNTEMADFYASQDGTRMFAFLASCWANAQ
jgi:Fic family protein